MSDLDIIINALEKSIDKHGEEKTLTLGHLYNLLVLAREIDVREDDQNDLHSCVFD